VAVFVLPCKASGVAGVDLPMNQPLHLQRPCLRRSAFTLIEILVVIGIIAIIAAFAFPIFGKSLRSRDQTAGLINLRQIGSALILYAGEHDSQLPNPAQQKPRVSWPKAIQPYLKDLQVLAAPGKDDNYIKRKVDPVSQRQNNTSFIMNGFNDIGTWKNPNGEVRLVNIQSPAETLMLGMQKSGSRHFYMDFLEPPRGNSKDLLDFKAYEDGSNYLFVDGSSRFITEKDYRDELWLTDKTWEIPEL
jgi:prepilin-type N-terminal cleavage/methylation domain-containing protein/prepilin-type processing-associated H-X9-DG protein